MSRSDRRIIITAQPREEPDLSQIIGALLHLLGTEQQDRDAVDVLRDPLVLAPKRRAS